MNYNTLGINRPNDPLADYRTEKKQRDNIYGYNKVYSNILTRTELMCRSIFKWDNLPDSLSVRFLEKCLYRYGACYLYKHPDFGFIFVRGAETGHNYYDEPTQLNIYGEGLDGYKLISMDNVVPIYNNALKIPTEFFVYQYASRVVNVIRTIDTNILTMRMPYIFETAEKTRLTAVNIMQQINANEPFVIVDKNIQLSDSLKVLNTDTPYNVDKLTEFQKTLTDDFLTFLGIDNANTQKRERLIQAEVDSNKENITVNGNIFYSERKLSAIKMSKMLGYEIDVNFVTESGDKSNGALYSDSTQFTQNQL